MDKRKSCRHSARDNKATDKNISCDKFTKKNEDVPTQSLKKKTCGKINADVLGSYTGVPQDKNEMPVQDADDL